LRVAYSYIILQLFLCTQIPIYSLANEDRLDRRIAKDDTGGEEAIYDRCGDLD
jgi:hypothetical protein